MHTISQCEAQGKNDDVRVVGLKFRRPLANTSPEDGSVWFSRYKLQTGAFFFWFC